MPDKENSSRLAKDDGCQSVGRHSWSVVDAHINSELGEFVVGSHIKDMDPTILTRCSKGIPIARHEVDAIDIAGVSHERLDRRFGSSNVPDFGRFVYAGRHEDISIGRTERQKVDMFRMFSKSL